MIQLEGVSKAYGDRVLFRGVSWQLGGRERIGLVGPNGVGKTTLCRILAGLEPSDTGRVSRAREATVGYLPQEAAGEARGSVLAEVLSGFPEVWAIERQLEDLGARLHAAPDEALTVRYGDLQHRFEALGGYRLETEARVVLGGLGFREADLARPLREFSGGWRMRAALARLLLQRPTLLLLDEPTNHLDLESLGWLENYLTAYDGTVVVVAHDRYVLNRMVTAIGELSAAGLDIYPGDYDDYLAQREARQALLEARARNQAKRVAEIEHFIERFRYKATKARQVQSRIKMLARLDRVEVAGAARQVRFAFPAPPRTGRHVVQLRRIAKAYGPKVVYAGVDLDLERGDRIALVGPNGAGKSTLLRILAGVLAPDGGERVLGAHVTAHYYAQHQLDALDPARTVLEEMEAAAPETDRTRLRTLLGAFLFSGDAVDKRVAVLSGGEKARLALARMLVRPAPLLCLDEPTNHLDLASRAVLEDALADFPGTMVFISHDRYFINRLATKVVEVRDGRLVTHLGGYDDYHAAVERAPARAPGPTAEPAAPRAAEAPRPGDGSAAPARAPERPDRARRRPRVDPAIRGLRRRLDTLEAEIHAIEARLESLGRALADPALYTDGERARAVALERQQAEEQVAWLLHEWETLSESLAAHE
ncbi:MAG TPA: ABC-F family ATP-binding cassette domain-containing protein [Vicinamibacteria bacterium]|nr:ABC-F family ATP-binding cassette domain-containing protein [Vicinamibacteria bacterium]